MQVIHRSSLSDATAEQRERRAQLYFQAWGPRVTRCPGDPFLSEERTAIFSQPATCSNSDVQLYRRRFAHLMKGEVGSWSK